MMRAASLLVVLAACGDNAPAVAPCEATFTGNFAERSQGSADCPRLDTSSGEAVLSFGIPSQIVGATVGITLDLGAPATPGPYTAASVTSWDVLGLRVVPTGACVLIGGSSSVPAGSFALELAALEPEVHGTLVLQLSVLAETSEQGQQSDCGSGANEQLALAF